MLRLKVEMDSCIEFGFENFAYIVRCGICTKFYRQCGRINFVIQVNGVRLLHGSLKPEVGRLMNLNETQQESVSRPIRFNSQLQPV